MPKLTRKSSYETIKFDTPDGDIHKNQYAIYGDSFVVRLDSEKRSQFLVLHPSEVKNIPQIISGMSQIQIISGEFMYYDEFEMPDGSVYRVPTTKQKFVYCNKKGATLPTKTLTAKQIEDIKKEVF